MLCLHLYRKKIYILFEKYLGLTEADNWISCQFDFHLTLKCQCYLIWRYQDDSTADAAKGKFCGNELFMKYWGSAENPLLWQKHSVTLPTKSQCAGCRHSRLSVVSNGIRNGLSWKTSNIKRWPFNCRLWDHLRSHRFDSKQRFCFCRFFKNYMVFRNFICMQVKKIPHTEQERKWWTFYL